MNLYYFVLIGCLGISSMGFAETFKFGLNKSDTYGESDNCDNALCKKAACAYAYNAFKAKAKAVCDQFEGSLTIFAHFFGFTINLLMILDCC